MRVIIIALLFLFFSGIPFHPAFSVREENYLTRINRQNLVECLIVTSKGDTLKGTIANRGWAGDKATFKFTNQEGVVTKYVNVPDNVMVGSVFFDGNWWRYKPFNTSKDGKKKSTYRFAKVEIDGGVTVYSYVTGEFEGFPEFENPLRLVELQKDYLIVIKERNKKELLDKVSIQFKKCYGEDYQIAETFNLKDLVGLVKVYNQTCGKR